MMSRLMLAYCASASIHARPRRKKIFDLMHDLIGSESNNFVSDGVVALSFTGRSRMSGLVSRRIREYRKGLTGFYAHPSSRKRNIRYCP